MQILCTITPVLGKDRYRLLFYPLLYQSIAPRYDDYYLHTAYPTIRTGYMRFDYNMSKGMYYAEWNYVIQNAKSVKLVLLDSWNEYHERTAIEPHADLTAGYFSRVGGTSCFVRLLDAAGVETTTTATSATSPSEGGGIPELAE